MAVIWQRENGHWTARIRRKGFPDQTETHRSRADAAAWARDVESRMDERTFSPTQDAERNTFNDIAKRFRADFAPHHYRGKAWQHKLDKLQDRLGSYSLIAITPPQVARYRDERLKDADSRIKKPTEATPRVSPATVKSEIDLLSKVFDVAQKEFGISLPMGNPVAGVRKPKGGSARDRRLTASEWNKLMKECLKSRNPHLAAATTLAVETAMRQGEMLSVQWQNIDFERQLALLLDPTKIKTEEPRAVPLSSRALAALETIQGERTGRVFKTDRMTLYSAFVRACGRAGISDFTWHDLRHEALSRLAERGDFSVLEMAAVSGHKTLQMLKRYTHLQAENLARKLG
jgi:integrase